MEWTQEIGSGLKPMGEMITASSSTTCSSRPVVQQQERKVRPQRDQALNCPRCHSTNTKFCYYNNYSLTQPRYFCKTCRRYWTEGGTLRNVPVGGGSRKNKRSSSTSSINTPHKLPDQIINPPNVSHFVAPTNPNNKIHPADQGQDLNLGYPIAHHEGSKFLQLPKIDGNINHLIKSSSSFSSTSSTVPFAALELLRTGIVSSGMNSFFTSTTTPAAPPDLNANLYTSGFSFQDLKPAAAAVSSFSVDPHHGVIGSTRYANNVPSGGSGIQENIGTGMLMFPLGSIKQAIPSSTSEVNIQNNKGGQSNSNGFWNGMLGGGGSSW
ncbi:hypothetical protein ACH5RR_024209 [Cinchona calisaya]|uniref:Dof zinc finger protein n=1 Tax=Cinchona calisaya TaxID=153742 RepID=A0ABD2ZGQ3_9GENT